VRPRGPLRTGPLVHPTPFAYRAVRPPDPLRPPTGPFAHRRAPSPARPFAPRAPFAHGPPSPTGRLTRRPSARLSLSPHSPPCPIGPFAPPGRLAHPAPPSPPITRAPHPSHPACPVPLTRHSARSLGVVTAPIWSEQQPMSGPGRRGHRDASYPR